MKQRTLQLSDRGIDLDTGRITGGAKLRPTERALLVYLAERIGRWVSLDELHRCVWGYAATTRSRTAYTAAARLRQAIEPDPSAPRHLLSERGGGYCLVDAIVVEAPADRAPWTNLAPPSALVGRERELERLAARAALHTVVGPGGAGKTSLAAAAAWASAAPGGVWSCDLSRCRAADDAREALDGVLPGAGSAPLVVRLHALGEVAVLLDDVNPRLAPIVDQWMRGAPDARWFATGRAPLGLAAERVLRLGPLPTAVSRALLADRIAARGCEPLDDAALAALAATTDGLPLAIELIAGNAALLGPSAVIERVRAGRELPAAADRALRQRSLDEVLRWSWDQLSDAHRGALAALAVLDGPFGLADAERAIGPSAGDGAALVAELVERSLVLHPTDGAFALLSTVRSGVRRLGAADGRAEPPDAVLDRLLAARIARADAAGEPWAVANPAPRSPTAVAVIAQLVARLWARPDVAPPRRAHVSYVLCREVSTLDAPVTQLVAWTDRALADHPTPICRAALLFQRARLRRRLGDPAGALDDYAESAAVSREAGAPREAWLAWHNLGELASRIDRVDLVEQTIARLDADDGGGSGWAAGSAAYLRSQLAARGDDLAAAEAWVRASVEAFTRSGAIEHAAQLGYERARLMLLQCRLDEVEGWLDAHPGSQADALRCNLLVLRGDADTFEAVARSSLDRLRQRDRWEDWLAWCDHLGFLALLVGRTELGTRWLRERLAFPAFEVASRVGREMCQALLHIVEGRAEAAWPHLADASALAASHHAEERQATVALLQAQVRWSVGDLDGVCGLLDAAMRWDRPLDAAALGLLLAEAELRRGRRDRVRALAGRLAAIRLTPVARAQLSGLLATCAAIDGAHAERERHLRETTGASGLGARWVHVHRGWARRLVGEPVVGPDPAEAAVRSPLDLAVTACEDELFGPGPIPGWALR